MFQVDWLVFGVKLWRRSLFCQRGQGVSYGWVLPLSKMDITNPRQEPVKHSSSTRNQNSQRVEGLIY